MSWLENLIFGLVSGLTEFLPISSTAHQALLMKLFGVTQITVLHAFTIHLGLFLGLLTFSMTDLIRFRREMRLARIPPRQRRRQPDMRIVLDRRILLSGSLLAAAGGFLSGLVTETVAALSIVCIMLVINGSVLFIPSLYSSGNKDSRHLSPVDGWLFGLCAGIGMLPGLSRIALVSSAAALRGADRKTANRFGVLLGIPSIMGLLAADLYRLFSDGPGTFGLGTLGLLLCALITSFAGTSLGLKILNNISTRRSGSGFSYYCWGAALLALILHLSVS